jgi:thiol-disulfide isomerase/thioredoxin
MRSIKKIAAAAGAFLLLQSVALFIFREVKTRRQQEQTRFSVERLTRAAPVIACERRDGSIVELRGDRPRLLLFWATWCPPCRKEMPVFLEAAQELVEDGIEVYAISADERWEDVDRFFDGSVPKEIVRAPSKAELAAFEVGALPDAYLISRSGQIVARFAGERDWSLAADVVKQVLR